MGIETAIIVGALIATGGVVGSSAYQAKEEKKAQKKMIEYQEEQVAKAETKAKQAQSLATQEADVKAKRYRLSQTKTILTSPLGLKDNPTVGTKNLLGG